ncbi:hypothetical protein AAFF_G00068660 [Aldrovandia affinis]|uniref:C-type lectin domain-containing protein n=1 Tax=Aldrovandia affinis TaxID=143900 RepID=A0AAD7R3T8_9TELE|nr:hypothetical protein AAFF_G00068660 [Aldrovandia affinis]
MCTAQWARPHTTAQELSTQREVDKAHIPTDWLECYCPLRSQKRVCRPCPEGWEQRNSTCYYFSTEDKSWMDSRIDCLKQGADLVIIESEEEQDFIYKHTGGSDSGRRESQMMACLQTVQLLRGCGGGVMLSWVVNGLIYAAIHIGGVSVRLMHFLSEIIF